jgi:hypothetical protein
MRERTVGGGLVGEQVRESSKGPCTLQLIVLLALVTPLDRPDQLPSPLSISTIYSFKYRYTEEKSFFESSGYRFTAST